jgi:hypothetical protein
VKTFIIINNFSTSSTRKLDHQQHLLDIINNFSTTSTTSTTSRQLRQTSTNFINKLWQTSTNFDKLRQTSTNFLDDHQQTFSTSSSNFLTPVSWLFMSFPAIFIHYNFTPLEHHF